MARVQPVLSPSELALVDQMAEMTAAKRAEVVKNALVVYHWFVRQSVLGSKVVARKPTGEETTLETAELEVLQGRGNRLSAKELGALATELANATDPRSAARIRERMTRGFYGI